MSAFFEVSFVIAITAIISILLRLLKQPLIIGYIAAGIIAGPYFLKIISAAESFETFSRVGVALLLFIVGLGLDPKVIKETAKASLITGIGQVVFTSFIGFFIGLALGFSILESLYLSVALTFSSTIIIVKLLTDKNETETLYGKIAIGFLIVQDLISVLILMAIPTLSSGVAGTLTPFLNILLGVIMLSLVFAAGRLVLLYISQSASKNQEVLFLFSIAWVLAISAAFYYFNFSLEIGALAAGIALSSSFYKYEVASKLKPLRDFFVALFFIMLGSQMNFLELREFLLPIIVFSIFILIGNPLIVMILMGLLGYTKRTGFLAGLTVAQISEFSIILIGVGVQFNHLSSNISSLITAIGLITIATSTYLILYASKIYQVLAPYLTIFERKTPRQEININQNYEAILFGYNRIGYDLLKTFKNLKKNFLVIDYNPETIKELSLNDINCRYGDASDIELLNEINFSQAEIIVSTIPEYEVNALIIEKIRQTNKEAIIMAVAHRIEDALKLYELGASYVITPHFLGGYFGAELIERHQSNKEIFVKERKKHLENLLERKRLGHQLPEHQR